MRATALSVNNGNNSKQNRTLASKTPPSMSKVILLYFERSSKRDLTIYMTLDAQISAAYQEFYPLYIKVKVKLSFPCVIVKCTQLLVSLVLLL